ncbi:3'-5' exonuclease [Myxococcota bacterium]|nr:3'-5' exonuclease [Myxococcota bacterium]MBU1536880.1 3'-5' exonuclease [Myxococcota bacterium]
MPLTSYSPLVIHPHVPLREAVFAALDTETTGLSPTGSYPDRVVELGAVKFNAAGEILDRFGTLVDPQRPIPRDAQAVHGISNAHVKGAPRADSALPSLMEFLEGTHMLWGFNSPFDMRFLVGEFLQIGAQPPAIEFYDVRRMLKRSGLPTGTLENVSRALRIRAATYHRATADAETTGLLLVKVLEAAFKPSALLADLARLHCSSSPVYNTARCLKSFS